MSSKRTSIVGVLILGILVVLAIVYLYSRKDTVVVVTPQYRAVQVSLGGKILNARVADTDSLRIQGLSGTSGLDEDDAMLFVFDTVGLHSFWMKDMQYPIDIIWIDQSKHIVSIKKHATPESYPAQFNPPQASLYVLEVIDGFVGTHKVKVGDAVSFEL